MAELVSLCFAVFSLAVQLSSRKAQAASEPAPAVRRRRRSKYSGEVCAACLAYWHAAKRSSAARNGINTRMTYKAAFAYFATKLRELGIKTVEVFKRIIHAVQSRECEDRRKDLEAKKEDEARKSASKSNTKRGENGIMSSVKTRAATALALTLSVVGAMALPLRSAASSQDLRGTSPQSHVAAGPGARGLV